MESTMTSTPAVPEVPGIDLSFRPHSYFLPPEVDVRHLAHVAGQVRREVARELLAAGEEDLPTEFLAELLDEETRTLFGQMHPMCMGGEYLPPLKPTEIAIARRDGLLGVSTAAIKSSRAGSARRLEAPSRA